jgi:hypothetical protein
MNKSGSEEESDKEEKDADHHKKELTGSNDYVEIEETDKQEPSDSILVQQREQEERLAKLEQQLYASVNPDEIPPVPSNRFLMRKIEVQQQKQQQDQHNISSDAKGGVETRMDVERNEKDRKEASRHRDRDRDRERERSRDRNRDRDRDRDRERNTHRDKQSNRDRSKEKLRSETNGRGEPR